MKTQRMKNNKASRLNPAAVASSLMQAKTEAEAVELVNHPVHYRGTRCPNCSSEIVDSADIFDQWWFHDPHLWQAGKYMQRAGRKVNDESQTAADLRDLEKAEWYLKRAIARRRKILNSKTVTGEPSPLFKHGWHPDPIPRFDLKTGDVVVTDISEAETNQKEFLKP